MPPPLWAKPRFVVAAILVYCAAHFAIRMALGPSLGVDDAEQMLFAQDFSWSYRYRAPPLFTWLLVAIGQVFPIGVVAISVVRYALLGATYALLYLTARRLIADARLSALSVYAFAAVPAFAEASHRNLTHSTMLAALLALTWFIVVRLAAAPRLGWYLALGASCGLGLLAKWNFVILAVALALSALLTHEGRRLVLTWNTLAAVAVGALIAAPSSIAALAMGPPPGEDIGSVLATGRLGAAAIAKGTLGLAETALVYSLPLLIATALLFAPALWRGIRAPASGEAPPGAVLVGPSIALGLMLLLALVVGLGATEFRVRYMHPILLVLPLWLFMIIERGRPGAWAPPLFALLMAAMALEVAGKRVLQSVGVVDCGLCLERSPYGNLAAALAGAGYRGSGTILAEGGIGGNIRARFPDARVIDPGFPLGIWPRTAGDGQCLILWQEGEPPTGAPPWAGPYVAGTLGGDPAAASDSGIVSAPMLAPAEGTLSLGYQLYRAPNGECG